MKKVIMSAVVVVMCGGSVYAGGLEGERANSGGRFGETVMIDEVPAVRLNGDFRAAPKAALTAEVKQESRRLAVPTLGTDSPSTIREYNDDVTRKRRIGRDVSAFAGAGAALLTMGAFLSMPFTLCVLAGLAAAILVGSAGVYITNKIFPYHYPSWCPRKGDTN